MVAFPDKGDQSLTHEQGPLANETTTEEKKMEEGAFTHDEMIGTESTITRERLMKFRDADAEWLKALWVIEEEKDRERIKTQLCEAHAIREAPSTRVRPQKRNPAERVCSAKGCSTILSIYNEDPICAQCGGDRGDRLAAERLQAACRRPGIPTSLFYSEAPRAIAQAKSICAKCPIRESCLEDALENREPCGVWGGELIRNGHVLTNRKRRSRHQLVRPEPMSPVVAPLVDATSDNGMQG
jgi:WhiB family redox-sensing transcriptional regulator